MTCKVGVFVGSLRKESYNRKLATALKKMAPEGLELQEVGIGELPLYNQDHDDGGNPPAAYGEFRERLKGLDAFLFLTPEYNRSVPAVLKNALDVGSRPYGKNLWNGKPGAVMSLSIGAIAGFGANHHLRQSLVFLNVPVMQQPEAYLGNAASLFDADGGIGSEDTRRFLENFMAAFAAWVAKFVP